MVAVDVPHHVTQRENGRRFVVDGDADRTIYLKLLRENIFLYGVALIGYCPKFFSFLITPSSFLRLT